MNRVLIVSKNYVPLKEEQMDLMNLVKTAAGAMLGDKGMEATKIMGVVSQLLEQTGGMNQMVEKFNSAGLGNVVQSWVSQGQNLPISADQIAKVFGNEQIGQIASQFNMNGSDLGKTLAGLLPQVVDKLTPTGQVTNSSVSMTQLLELGKTLLANKA